ncbi:MAG: hypothetical protein A2898_04145 [Candidatus Kerfeldbacteria bacterium RIFCSPLOWO2_01_FULL_48_11]|uniref:alanine--tRNA ligase n=2 Tax=Parcubacteria group TaxID=1794811 RepID=A0A1G1Y7S8_9BACT|nr:MAG: Alanine-tRNA ligase [Parcubacteria group bacterium GW2011_GWA2_48_9]KKW16331.1 MAG: Alanine-tRNA ligase [Parcubacteria group bacterium GW2011_GWC2_49_9]OGY48234.1 MAG: hypothetical protein A2840_00525 [Candidatus Buchananbacteria bacterium RIFCSPHIGHO2_01_FULL_47_11b]OGY82760.1 MAG: hypothetical protein A2898_04145 [Candidatus Kerfeldbacteria bacterium RIFCSPLOWO2_01_FULL_48_11]
MTTNSLRKKFLQFFKKNGHTVLPSSSLIPANDPSVLFTTAGMQQFKSYFLGKKDAQKDFGSRRLATSQLCIRTSDIESVGDVSHLTFFEMLGNFSIGDYFKKEAIDLGYQFLVHRAHLQPEKIYATYFSGADGLPEDREARTLLENHVAAGRIHGFPKKDNWWGPTGDAGPCGPCAEFHYDLTGVSCEKGTLCIPNCTCGRFVEIWNLVFTEYDFHPGKKLALLPQKNIDTGLGLERLAMAVQKKTSVYETDGYESLIDAITSDKNFGSLGASEDKRRVRIVADHLKACFFIVIEGVQFSNKERGYVLRRLYRRAADQFMQPSFSFFPFMELIARQYEVLSPQLSKSLDEVRQLLEREDVSYKKILSVNVEDAVKKYLTHTTVPDTQQHGIPSKRALPASDAFQLYSTYGISPERLQRAGFTFSITDFDKEVASHQEKSRAGSESKFGGHGLSSLDATSYSDKERWQITKLHTATHLLHQALRSILGNHVRQQGSDITPERLRFDFEHPEKLTDQQKKSIEELVNAIIQQDLQVTHEEMSLDDALASGALSFFREKYPPRVTIYRVGDFSKEICGGPHVTHSKQIGKFSIASEKSSSAGVRRIKAVVDGGNDAPDP